MFALDDSASKPDYVPKFAVELMHSWHGYDTEWNTCFRHTVAPYSAVYYPPWRGVLLSAACRWVDGPHRFANTRCKGGKWSMT